MRDLQRKDCVYENGFPANIEWCFTVVVQIAEDYQGIILYTSKTTGKQCKSYLHKDLNKVYTNDTYIFNA